MKFLNEIPTSGKLDSPSVITELKANPGKWGEFYVQAKGADVKAARQKATSLRSYIKRNNLNVEVVAQISAEDGLVHCYARWNG